MRIARTLPELRAALGVLGQLAIVPTMGALHDGHLALLDAAKMGGSPVAASIFVNPLQFGANEDLSRYPRDEAGDLAKLRDRGCDLVWMPEVGTMYPKNAACTINVAGPALRWEGELRPGHFTGVATVVAKLFGQMRPHTAYFGEKDWQQIQVLRRMVEDFLLPVRIAAVPTIREPDGLALSSRNRFLNASERAAAPALYVAISHTAAEMAAGQPVNEALRRCRHGIEEFGMAVDYLAVVDAVSLEPLPEIGPPARLLAAAKLGAVRLLDNLAVIRK